MALSPGTRLGPYEIVRLIGSGGMGEVYSARDTRLERTVAIKVLPTHLGAEPERRQRFEREARIVSSLNHPHICTLYDVGRQDGVDFLVMEYLEGETLAKRLEQGALSREEFLRYGIQIADALEKAHAAGIVHRDIKPANIIVTGRKSLKVLDFGLAKLSEPLPEESMALTQSAKTENGAILGTVSYMSPEQAEGKPVDARSDIFSFGSMLYEMITGRRPFEGKTRISTLSAILRDEPRPADELAGGVSRELGRVLTRCLRKDPDRRFQHMGDVRIALEELKEETDSGSIASPPVAVGRPRRRWLGVAAAGLLMVAAIAGTIWWMRRSAPAGPGLILSRLTWDSGLTTDPALSPDGKLVAYASDRSGEGNLDVWVQQVAGGEAIRLTRHEADEHEPAFSPDGTKIAFRSEREGGGLYLISTLGGEERLIARNGRRPRFSPDGSLIAYTRGAPGTAGPSAMLIYVVPASGGPPRQLYAKFINARDPLWAPDGRFVLFWGRATPKESFDWLLGTTDESSVTKSGLGQATASLRLLSVEPAAWTADGSRLLFSARLGDSTNLWEISVSPKTGQPQGLPRRLTFGAGHEALASVSTTGRVAFASLNQTVNIWSLPIQANEAKVSGPLQQLTQDAAQAHWPSLSPDGKKLVFVSQKSGNNDVWVRELVTGKETALTATPADEVWPAFSGDGSKVVYAERHPGTSKNKFYVVPTAGGVPEKVCDDCWRLQQWSPDGRVILYHDLNLRTIYALDVQTGRKTSVIRHSQYGLFQEHFSPDGRWITFLMRISPDRTQLFIAPYKGVSEIPEKEWIPITDGAGADDKPRLSPDGNLLYFTSERDGFRCIWVQRLDPAGKHPAGPPFPLYHAHSARRTLQSVELVNLEISVAHDKIVFNMVGRTGNIWLAAP